MTTYGQVVTNGGRRLMQNRTFNSSPTITTPSLFSVGTGSTLPQVTDSMLQTPVIITGGSYTKIFITGYPTFDVPNIVTTISCQLLTTDANGNSLTEFGILNTDGSPVLFSHCTHMAITKTTSTQVIYVQKFTVTT
jgi:hypothetical protein